MKRLLLFLFLLPFCALAQVGIYPQATASGTNTYTATVSGLTSLIANQRFTILFTNGNTTASTLDPDGAGSITAKPITIQGTNALVSGDIDPLEIKILIYDGTRFQIIGDGGGSGDALTSNPLSQFASTTSAQLGTVLTDESGTGTVAYSSYVDAADVLKIDKLITANRQTSSYTLVIGDAVKIVEMNSASANNLTVPLNSSVAFPIGTQILVAQYGAGQTTFVATGGVTIRSDSGKLKLSAQYAGATLLKIGTDEWYLFGALTN